MQIQTMTFSDMHKAYSEFDEIYTVPVSGLAPAKRPHDLRFSYHSKLVGESALDIRRWARQVSVPELSKIVDTSWGERLLAETPDYYIVYNMTQLPQQTDFTKHVISMHKQNRETFRLHPDIIAVEEHCDHWLVEGNLFRKTYQDHGDGIGLFDYNEYGLPVYSNELEMRAASSFKFFPCMKTSGVIAKRVGAERIGVISMENANENKDGVSVSLIPEGFFVVIGAEGEPYSNDPEFFAKNYYAEPQPVGNSPHYSL